MNAPGEDDPKEKALNCSQRQPMKPYLRVTLFYFLFGLLWIIFSDSIIQHSAFDLETSNLLQTFKGWFFVLLSSVLIFFLTRKAFLDHLAKENEKRAVFRKTVEGAHHILLNYLNQMQLFTLKAEECKDFDPADIELAKLLSEEAASELKKMRDVDSITPERIHSVIYQKIQKRN
jgi:flagellar biosynthesis/type III secretory pathway M-ring protein FliF/YscJ